MVAKQAVLWSELCRRLTTWLQWSLLALKAMVLQPSPSPDRDPLQGRAGCPAQMHHIGFSLASIRGPGGMGHWEEETELNDRSPGQQACLYSAKPVNWPCVCYCQTRHTFASKLSVRHPNSPNKRRRSVHLISARGTRHASGQPHGMR